MRSRLFVFLALTYVATLGGHVYSGDELMMARVTEAVVTRGELSVRPIEHFEDYATVEGQDGRTYTWYGVGLPIAAIPFYLAGMALEEVVPDSAVQAFSAPKVLYYDRDNKTEVVRMFALTFTNPLVTALTVVLLFNVLVMLGIERRAAAISGVVFGLTGVTWFYAKTFFSEPLSALLLLLSLYAWLAMRRGQKARWAFAAGLFAGMSCLARVANGIVLLPLSLLFLAERLAQRDVRKVLWAALGVAMPLALLGALNWLRFGHPFETGYWPKAPSFDNDPVEGLIGLSLSPGRGFVWYFPWVLLAAPGIAILARRDLWTAAYCGLAFVALWGLYAFWPQWDGGWVFGPRFLVPVFPLMAIPATLFVSEYWHQTIVKVLFAVLAFFCFALALHAVSVNFLDYHFAMWRSVPSIEQAMRWSWEWSPLCRYWDFPVRTFLIMPRLALGDGGLALAILAWAVFLGLAASLWAFVSALARPLDGEVECRSE